MLGSFLGFKGELLEDELDDKTAAIKNKKYESVEIERESG